MRFVDYQTIFRTSEMKALVAWDILERLDCKVEEIYTRSVERLSCFHTLWYRTQGGKDGDWRNAEDIPLRVGEASSTFDSCPSQRREHVTAFREKFAQTRKPLQLTLPAYSPNDHDTILLDGTHRAVAAYLAHADVRLLIFAVRGPCDPRILPDLQHYSD
jgi:hypothetical protein